MKSLTDNSRGFTLIELMITVIIIGILATIAIPGYLGFLKQADRAEATSNLQSLRLLEEQYFSENSIYAPTESGLANIQLVLKGFQPGLNSQLKYDYAITLNIKADGTPQTPCFRASATPKTGTRVAGEAAYYIDCNNNRTGGVTGTWP